MKKGIVFAAIAVTDLSISYFYKDGAIFLPVLLAIFFFISLIWFGNLWNMAFPTGVATSEIPVITQETPPLILAILGWLLLALLTVFLVVKCL